MQNVAVAQDMLVFPSSLNKPFLKLDLLAFFFDLLVPGPLEVILHILPFHRTSDKNISLILGHLVVACLLDKEIGTLFP